MKTWIVTSWGPSDKDGVSPEVEHIVEAQAFLLEKEGELIFYNLDNASRQESVAAFRNWIRVRLATHAQA